MTQEGAGRITLDLDRVVMAAGLGTLSASEMGGGFPSFRSPISGTIDPARHGAAYEGVKIPDHLADALNRLARR